jgi:hypothetical protein
MLSDMQNTAGERDLYAGLIRLHVLHHAGEQPLYGQAGTTDADGVEGVPTELSVKAAGSPVSAEPEIPEVV